MAVVRVNPQTAKLFLDFRFQGKRFREYTTLSNTQANQTKLGRKGQKIESEIALGKFNYAKHFPNSANANKLNQTAVSNEQQEAAIFSGQLQSSTGIPTHVYAEYPEAANRIKTPLFKVFVDEWLAENKIAWRRSHLVNIENMIKKYYVPKLGGKEVGSITRADLLKFRSDLAKVPGRNGNITLSANRINKIMDPLKRVFEEAADRFEFNTPFARIKPLKIQKSDVQPFTLQEVLRIVNAVRSDFKNYYLIRFFTGMRTGEIDGLKWKYVDFERKQILIRETIVGGEEDYTKTDSSQRAIIMSGPVLEALQEQYKATAHLSQFVFCNLKGGTVDHNNITKRVWYPLLAKLKLTKRRPYQSRHTAATLWLAAGEAPEWIAQQMGYSNTEMLFKVYSRFVPNLTRRDGSAFEQLLLTQQAKHLEAANEH